MSVTVKKTGFKFASLTAKMRTNIAGVLNEGAESMVSLAKQLSPVLTGYMRDNIEQTEKATPDNGRVSIESKADYSVFVEYGTVNMDAQPFMHPAFESSKRQVNNGLKRVLQGAV